MSQGITDILPKMTDQEKEALKKGIDVDERSFSLSVSYA